MENCCRNMNLIGVYAQCDDRCCIHDDEEHLGYVEGKFGIGNGDAIEFEYCSNCGKIRGTFPLDLE